MFPDNGPMDVMLQADAGAPGALAVVAARYDAFARVEAPGRSAQYVAWAERVAASAVLQDAIAGIRPDRRQPALVFAVARLLGAPADAGSFAEWVPLHAGQLRSECEARALQTNEPQRAAPLLIGLDALRRANPAIGPIALLEVGASAGLCLYPDRYSYRFGDGTRLDPAGGASAVELSVALPTPLPRTPALPEIVWRAGIDLSPLEPAAPKTGAWLEALLWPGERERAGRLRAALEVAAAEPPLLVAGDAATDLAALAARAPADATLVITTPGVLVHVPRAAREQIVAAAMRLGHWISLDPPALTGMPASGAFVDGAPERGFDLRVDGAVVAAADPLGHWVAWRGGEAVRPT